MCWMVCVFDNWNCNNNFYKAFGKNLQNENFLSSLVAHGLLFSSFSSWPTGFYSEENCQTIAHGPLLDWASGRKALAGLVYVLNTAPITSELDLLSLPFTDQCFAERQAKHWVHYDSKLGYIIYY